MSWAPSEAAAHLSSGDDPRQWLCAWSHGAIPTTRKAQLCCRQRTCAVGKPLRMRPSRAQVTAARCASILARSATHNGASMRRGMLHWSTQCTHGLHSARAGLPSFSSASHARQLTGAPEILRCPNVMSCMGAPVASAVACGGGTWELPVRTKARFFVSPCQDDDQTRTCRAHCEAPCEARHSLLRASPRDASAPAPAGRSSRGPAVLQPAPSAAPAFDLAIACSCAAIDDWPRRARRPAAAHGACAASVPAADALLDGAAAAGCATSSRACSCKPCLLGAA